MDFHTLGNRQFRYTPDAGTERRRIHCGVCSSVCRVERNKYGPRGMVQAWMGGKSHYDLFECPKHEQDWHVQVCKIKDAIHECPSPSVQKLMREDVEQILKENCC